jgi:hypothetical protein
MTEAEWLACDDGELMLGVLRRAGKVAVRKERLLLCALARTVGRPQRSTQPGRR